MTGTDTATEILVARHYAQDRLESRILAALSALGKDPATLTHADLALVDEFHIGGRRATMAMADHAEFSAGMRLLDVGCGVGGPARYFAAERGCQVTGIDLTAEFVTAAAALAARVGLADRVEYRQASALALPFEAGSFDGAYMLHVGMNIEDKAALFTEVRRVLRLGARFAVYDVMRDQDGDLRFPVPWASASDCSFLETPAGYRRLLNEAGFDVILETDRRAMGLAGMAAATAAPTVLVSAERRANLLANLEARLIAPIEMIARAASASSPGQPGP